MDGLSGAASFIAVIETSAKILSLCFQYSVAVKDAEKDIERLWRKVADLKDVLGDLKQLLDGQDKTRLSAAYKSATSLKDCLLRLEELKAQLDPGKTRKAMNRLGVRSLRWPFTSKEVEKIVDSLENYQQTFLLALQVDQTGLMLDFDQKIDFIDKKTDDLHRKIDLAKLPIAKGASFDSHMEEHNARCLGNTRVELQRHITEWAKDKNGKPVFWLNGMAGTGKSTIARTVAQSFAERGQLGASFFFKKGEGDRGNATRFITTIATELMVQIPGLIPGIRKAVDADPAICEKTLKDQFEKLILRPLSKIIEQAPPRTLELVVVIDALDECDREEDIRAILQLLARTNDIMLASLRVFLTSRPELPIRLGFKQLSDGSYQDLILHEVPKETIDQDIALFLEHELGKIREQRSLSPNWPGKDQIQTLVKMAIPLFIFAATACRYIGDQRGNPKQRLEIVIQYQTAPQVSMLDRTYLPILNQLFDDEDGTDKESWTSEFREIVGSIIVLESPLSIVSLTHLLGIPKEDISCRLDLLHSVLSIPVNEDMPVRLLHLSFRDFLLDPQKNGKSPFWIDERQTHKWLTSKCLQLMTGPNGLRQNMCSLSKPGTLSSEIDKQIVDRCLQSEVQYACRYWVLHLEQSKSNLHDSDPVYDFLQNYFLYWLEAMSLIREASGIIRMINSLQSLIDSSNSAKISGFLHDARRFTLRNQSILEGAPLQLYSSALIFTPETSIIRKRFNSHILKWTTKLSNMENNWNASLQTLEGHSDWVMAVAFSSDGQLVASGSVDCTIRLWDAVTGSCRSTLEGHSSGVTTAAFSPNSQLLASGSYDCTVRLWDAATGSCRSTLKGHSSWVRALAFSSDGQLVASGSNDCVIRLWDMVTGSCRSMLEGHSDGVSAIAFSPVDQLVVSGSDDTTVRLWDAAMGTCRSMLEGHSKEISAVAISPDGKLVASGSDDSIVRLWDVVTGSCRCTLEGHSLGVRAVAFSSDGQLVASGSDDFTTRLWDAVTGYCRRTLEGHSREVRAVVFSPVDQLVASGSDDTTVKLWDTAMGTCRNTLEGHSEGVSAVAFSPDGQLVVSGSDDSTVQVGDAATGSCSRTLEGHSKWVRVIAFSSDGQLVASGSDDSTIRLWETATGSCRNTFEGHLHSVGAVAFSSNGHLVASGSNDSTVRLWDVATGSCRNTLEGHSAWVSAVVFSPDSHLIASGSGDCTVRLWDAGTGSCRNTLKGHTQGVEAVAFSPDGRLLASGSFDFTVRLWDAATGSCHSTLEGHSSGVSAIAFSPDGQLLASGSVDSTVWLWDTATGPCRSTFKCHSGVISAIAFSLDGSHITTNRGRIALPSSFSVACPNHEEEPYSSIVVNDQWVTSAEQRLLWLPTVYRPTCTAVRGNLIWMGHASGRILFLELNLENIPRESKSHEKESEHGDYRRRPAMRAAFGYI